VREKPPFPKAISEYFLYFFVFLTLQTPDAHPEQCPFLLHIEKYKRYTAPKKINNATMISIIVIFSLKT